MDLNKLNIDKKGTDINLIANDTHCKISSIQEYLSIYGIDIKWSDLFALGSIDLLEFGLDKVSNIYLWFLLPYPFDCEKVIFQKLKIPTKKNHITTIDQLRQSIKDKKIVGIYYDNSTIRKKAQVFNEVKQGIQAKGKMKKSSLGLIKEITRDYLILNTIDIDNEAKKIPIENIKDELKESLIEFLPYEHTLSKDNISSLVAGNMYRVSSRHINVRTGYEYDLADDKYGTYGINSIAALYAEINHCVNQYQLSKSEIYLQLLIQRLNILRIYSIKGSNSCYRSEYYQVIKSLEQIYEFDAELITELEVTVDQAKKLWRNFNRLLFSVNYPFFRYNIEGFMKKLKKIMDQLYNLEEKFGQDMLNILINSGISPSDFII